MSLFYVVVSAGVLWFLFQLGKAYTIPLGAVQEDNALSSFELDASHYAILDALSLKGSMDANTLLRVLAYTPAVVNIKVYDSLTFKAASPGIKSIDVLFAELLEQGMTQLQGGKQCLTETGQQALLSNRHLFSE